MVYAGQGDPARTMALLWRAETTASVGTPGPKPGLSVDEVVAAAIVLADESGLDALSMRAVAERLGRSPMSLYTYVPGKAELVDLMVDQAHDGLGVEPDLAVGWRPAVRVWVDSLWERCLRHPWLLSVSHARPVLGPHEQALLEALLRVLEAAGIEARVRRGVVSALFSLVRAAAATAVEARAAAARTGAEDAAWWAARAGGLAEAVPDWAARFPASVRLATAAAGEWEGAEAGASLERAARDALDVGLGLLLDGVEAAARGASGRSG